MSRIYLLSHIPRCRLGSRLFPRVQKKRFIGSRTCVQTAAVSAALEAHLSDAIRAFFLTLHPFSSGLLPLQVIPAQQEVTRRLKDPRRGIYGLEDLPFGKSTEMFPLPLSFRFSSPAANQTDIEVALPLLVETSDTATQTPRPGMRQI